MNGRSGNPRVQRDQRDSNNSGRSTPDDFTSESSSSLGLIDRNGRQSRSLSRNIAHPYPRHTDSPTTSLELSRNSYRRRSDLPEPHVYIDSVSGQFNLSPSQAVTLHSQADSGLYSDHKEMLLHLENRAYQLKMDNILDTVLQKLSAVVSKVDNLQTQVNTNWGLSQIQREKIGALTKDTIFDPTRITYRQLGSRVKELAREDPQAIDLGHLDEHPERWVIVDKEISLRARLVRSQFRIALRDSVFGNKRASLEATLKDLAQKYRFDKELGLETSHEVRIAILRRFARENPDLLDRDEPEGEGEDASVPESSAQGSGKRKKKKATAQASKGVKGTTKVHWWYFIDNWFDERVREWGEKLDAPEWKDYIDETMGEEAKLSAGLIRRTLVSFGGLIGVSGRTGTAGSSHTSPRIQPLERPRFSESSNEGSLTLALTPGKRRESTSQNYDSGGSRSVSPVLQIPYTSHRIGAAAGALPYPQSPYSQFSSYGATRGYSGVSSPPPDDADGEADLNSGIQPRRLTLSDPRILAIQGIHGQNTRDRHFRAADGSRSSFEGAAPASPLQLPRISDLMSGLPDPSGSSSRERPGRRSSSSQLLPTGERDFSAGGSARVHDQGSGLSGGAQWMGVPGAGRGSSDLPAMYHGGAHRFGALDGGGSGGGGGTSWDGEGRERGQAY